MEGELSFHPDDLVQLNFQLRCDTLGRVLFNIVQAVQNTMHKVAEIGADVYQVRKQLQTMGEKMRESFSQEEAAREKVRRQVDRLGEEIKKMHTTMVTVKEFEHRLRIMQQNHQGLSDRLSETETTGGKKIISHIEGFVRRHVREWYDPIRTDEQKDLLGKLTLLQGEIYTTLRSEIATQEERQNVKVGDLGSKFASELQAAVAARDAAVTKIRETRDTDMAQVAASIKAVDDTHKRVQKESQQRTHERLAEVETRVSALYHGWCLSEDELRDIWDEHDKLVNAPGGDAGARQMVDRRTDVLHNTKPLLELRAKIQTDIRDRLHQIKEEDQDDFSRQITELQRDVRGKVSAQRVQEIVHENTDRALYESLQFVKARVQAIDTDKVGADTFNEALKSKSDIKLLDQKADRAFVTQLFEFLRNKIDEVRDHHKESVERAMTLVTQHRNTAVTLSSKQQTDDPDRQASQLLSIAGPPPPPPESAGPTPQQSPTMAKFHNTDHHGIGIIDAALNPKPEYQWASETQQRQGMAPGRTRGAATPMRIDQVRGLDTRAHHGHPAAGGAPRGPLSAGPRRKSNFAVSGQGQKSPTAWLPGESPTGHDDMHGSPLGFGAGPMRGGAPSPQSELCTRTQSEYLQAMAAPPQQRRLSTGPRPGSAGGVEALRRASQLGLALPSSQAHPFPPPGAAGPRRPQA
eukprot:TRINITY_DN60053_c0_g1_i1.p1 TRINITY_DN60053_c0_g1~~TRINITY_DN60053_c0_g1_i1.p1  ORF type:complete len:721 (+),score=225.04 TRINITY_DN60053_c0_g1_i1:93-2165(+)